MKLITVALLAVSVPAFAGPKQKKQAKQHVEKATKLFGDGKFADALVELQAANKLDPQPDLLFAIGQAHSKLGDCDAAAASFHAFAAAKKKKDIDDVVAQAIADCKPATPPEPPPAAVQDKVEPPPPPPEPAKVEPPPPPPPEPKPTFANPSPEAKQPPPPVAVVDAGSPGPSPWYHDKIGDALVVGSVAAVVVGAFVYRSAVSSLDAAEASHSLTDYNAQIDDAHGKRTDAVILFGAGGVLLTAGIIHYAMHSTHRERGVAVVPARGGGLVTWSGGF